MSSVFGLLDASIIAAAAAAAAAADIAQVCDTQNTFHLCTTNENHARHAKKVCSMADGMCINCRQIWIEKALRE